MGTTTIDAVDYDTFGTVALATSYLGGSLSPAAVAWRAAVTDTKGRGLVEATRLLLDEGLEVEGADLTTSNAPTNVLRAAYEFAALLVKSPALAAAANQSKNISSVGAGSATVSFFGPEEGGRFPSTVERLIGPYRPVGDAVIGGSYSSGTGEESGFEDYGLTGGQ